MQNPINGKFIKARRIHFESGEWSEEFYYVRLEMIKEITEAPEFGCLFWLYKDVIYAAEISAAELLEAVNK